MRGIIIKNSYGNINSTTTLFFWYNHQLIDPNKTVREFLKTSFNDQLKDGWLHLKVTTQETF
jgi:hypothetical protein